MENTPDNRKRVVIIETNTFCDNKGLGRCMKNSGGNEDDCLCKRKNQIIEENRTSKQDLIFLILMLILAVIALMKRMN